MIETALKALQERINNACERVGRDPAAVRLVAVSKGQNPDAIVEAYALGIRDFGENYAQELKAKQEALKGTCPEIRWHFLGRMQSNKMRIIAGADVVHTLDSFEHAELLARMSEHKPVQVFLQINLSAGETRSGAAPEEASALYTKLKSIAGLELRGLMTIAPLDEEPQISFEKMRALKQKIEAEGYAVPEMSMGMSADFEEAIAHGATLLRVGTLLFGERKSKSNH
jgi:pyridoxal phosphate enzyme (YggS family)